MNSLKKMIKSSLLVGLVGLIVACQQESEGSSSEVNSSEVSQSEVKNADAKSTDAKSSKMDAAPEKAITQNIEPLVSAKWLQENLNSSHLVIIDTTVLVEMGETGPKTHSGLKNYQQEHIPNARFGDLKGNLSAPDNELEFLLPTPEQFQIAMQELGVNKDSHVVLYSTENQSWPARVWWMLKWAGFDRASILNGGLNEWTKNGYEITSETKHHAAGNFEFNLRSDLVANSADVRSAIRNSKIEIVDSLSPSHYTGQFSMYARPGHITSAVNIPSSSFVDESGLFVSTDDLDFLLEGDRSKRTITYCGGGVAAANVAFNLHRVGYSDVAVYMGSLQEWTIDESNPMTIGSKP